MSQDDTTQEQEQSQETREEGVKDEKEALSLETLTFDQIHVADIDKLEQVFQKELKLKKGHTVSFKSELTRKDLRNIVPVRVFVNPENGLQTRDSTEYAESLFKVGVTEITTKNHRTLKKYHQMKDFIDEDETVTPRDVNVVINNLLVLRTLAEKKRRALDEE